MMFYLERLSINSHIKVGEIAKYWIPAKWLPLKMLYINYDPALLGTRKYWWLQCTFHCTFVNTGTEEKEFGIWSPAVAICYAQHGSSMNAMDLIGTHRLFDLLTVIPSCFSELKLKKCGISVSVHLFKVTAKFWTLLIAWWQGILYPLPTSRNLCRA